MSCSIPCTPHRSTFVAIGLATLLAVRLAAPPARAVIVTWDGGGPNDTWSTGPNWSADTAPVENDALVFAGSIRPTPINDLAPGATFLGITVPAGAGSFTLGGNSVTLAGSVKVDAVAPQTIHLPITFNSPQTVDIALGGELTIGPGANGSGIISGTGGLTKTLDGILNLNSANTYTGDTIIDGGILRYGVDNTVSNLIFGVLDIPPFSPANVSLDLSNASLTASSLNVRVNSPTGNVITVGAGKTLRINGAVTVGPNTSGLGVAGAGVVTRLEVGGAGTFVVMGTDHFTVGLPRLNADTGTPDPFSTVDFTGLRSFTYDAGTSGGELRVGGGNARGALTLADTSNTITAAAIQVGNSGITSGGGGNNNGGTSTLNFGAGTNVLKTATLNIGAVKSHGIVSFPFPEGSVQIAGQTDGTVTDITVGSASSATGNSNTSQFLLEGHAATVQAGTVIIGRLSGSTGGMGAGNVTFDTGVFAATSLQLAVNSSGSAPNGATGSFTLGASNASTGVLNVTGEFFLANRTNTASLTNPATGTFTINGGTANIDADIIDASTAGDPGTHTTNLILAGGTLNMVGHAIGSSAAPIAVVTLPAPGQAATLESLGGTGINGAGLVMDGGGTLTLDGTNSYSGTTTVTAGLLFVSGSVTGTSGVVVNGGELNLGAADRFADSATLRLNGGTFNSNGFNETLGAVTLGGSATLELGIDASVLRFANSSANNPAWTGTLNITNWSGSPTGGGTDQIFFGNSAAGLTTAQLQLIRFTNPYGPGSGIYQAEILSTGEIVAIPEPGTFGALLGGLGCLLFRRRRP